MKKVLIVGGGIAGVSLATFLSKKNISVDLIEALPRLGGRAFSFKTKENLIIDNGQHVLFGCYKNTLNYLKSIKKDKKLKFRRTIDFDIYDYNRKQNYFFSIPSFPPFFNIIYGLVKFKPYCIKEKIKILRIFLDSFFSLNKLDYVSFEDYLKKNNFTKFAEFILEPLLVSAYNSSLKDICAKEALTLLRKFFLGGFNSYVPIFPESDLSSLLYSDVEKIISQNDGKIFFSERVIEIASDGNSLISIQTNKREIKNFQFVVFAIPFYELIKITGIEKVIDIKSYRFDYSPIVSGYVFLRENNVELESRAINFVNFEIDWIFGKPYGFAFVKSTANELMRKKDEEIINILIDALKFISSKVAREFEEEKKIIIFREKRATIKSEIGLKKAPINTLLNNCFICGDWVETGLPPTIESAITSSRIVADKIIRLIQY